AAQGESGSAQPTPEQIEQAVERLVDDATLPFDNPQLRATLNAIQQRNEQTIDTLSVDVLREAGFSEADTERARRTVASFRRFIEEHRDEIDALQSLFNQPSGQQRPNLAQVKELAERLQQPPHYWTAQTLWQAYAHLEKNRVRGVSVPRLLTDLVSLVRHAVEPESELVPYPEWVRGRYEAWLAAQEAAGRSFTAEQRQWLDRIAEQVGVNLTVEPEDLDDVFHDKGARPAMKRVFGSEWHALLDELNTVLVA
ncbi:MAG TPA: type I restriction-modification enzyme R subunit C-terminal domain-containing protein, partial [Ardenticatenaceae bacterium]|nr:type I restriction-modification enzyme R subunit C-terminal domain-containing protein [Ardenticatenaceae bacterium]